MDERNELETSTELVVATSSLREKVFGENLTEESVVELAIRIEEKTLNVRELSAFFEMLDGIHGRLNPEGFRSYAQKREKQLTISDIRSGSWELIITEIVTSALSSSTIIIIWIILKIPKILETISSLLNDHKKRKKIDAETDLLTEKSRLLSLTREYLLSVPEYHNLNNSEKDEIAEIIINSVEKTPRLNRLAEFIEKNVISSELSITK